MNDSIVLLIYGNEYFHLQKKKKLLTGGEKTRANQENTNANTNAKGSMFMDTYGVCVACRVKRLSISTKFNQALLVAFK